jgi:CRISPR/Cas system CSM-associated protein Csm3 (group 7 of RAMP superfamily)
LETCSPLHVGDGDVRKDKEREIATVYRDSNGKPIIPGTSLRGFLRSSFEAYYDVISDETDELFGYQEGRPQGDTASALGGMLSVWDAPSIGEVGVEQSAHVVIDRRTRTSAAEDGLLYECDIVPEGAKFEVTLLVEGIPSRLKDDTPIAKLLGVLEAIPEAGERLGAGRAAGWGKVKWSLNSVKALSVEALTSWASKGGLLIDNLSPVKVNPVKPTTVSRWLRIGVELHFEERFLVKDPDRSKSGRNARDDSSDMEPRRTANNFPYLPGTSFHGALRSQAERVARTIGLEVRDVTKPDTYKDEIRNYHVIDCLFGGVGWNSVVQIDDEFVGTQTSEPKLQEFLAIDRFTGGGMDKAKFNARGYEQPVLKGSLKIDLRALKLLGSEGCKDLATLGRLLAFTFRDLQEGDIPLGMGASKGYGACRARFTDIGGKDITAKELARLLEESTRV